MVGVKELWIASDHAGVALKSALVSHLRATQYRCHDLGPSDSSVSVDYPDFALKVAHRVSESGGGRGILVCGSGIGMSIAANKVRGIRAAMCTSAEQVRLARAHNNLNILCLGERLLTVDVALDLVSIFLDSRFEGGRHESRVRKIERS